MEYRPDKELMIRWIQANVLFPTIQFSYTPWDFDNETVQICSEVLKLRSTFIDTIILLAQNAQKTGINIPTTTTTTTQEGYITRQLDNFFY
jgi:alpha-glucosidase (family GH31 glycosyl hydrolase)